jgi:membrane-bound metal-dependent hydrolase YbcI (DUF457 family)
MSWAAHELESLVLPHHRRTKVSGILLGCLLPDLFTKLPVYGLHIGWLTLARAGSPARYHRGWPGVGFTHSLAFGAVVAVVMLALTKNRAWALGLLVGQWAHALTDTFDSVGTMLFFPFTTQHYSIGMWGYAAQAGRYGDAAAYYSSFGVVWDLLWLLIALSMFSVFRRSYFLGTVARDDPAWDWLRRRFGLSERTVLAVYRAWFVYGACRIFAWAIWARVLNPARGRESFDFSWGGPSWVEQVRFPARSWAQFTVSTVWGATAVAVAGWLMWSTIGRRAWRRAT